MSAGVVGVILAAASAICFTAMRSELRGQVDESLRQQARLISTVSATTLDSRRLPTPPKQSGGGAPYVQFVSRNGHATVPPDETVAIPVTAVDRAVASGKRTQVLADRRVSGVHLRVITVHVSTGAVQLGRSLESIDSVLDRLRLLLAALVLGGVAVAAAVSRAFSRPVIAPIASLTDAAAHIEATGDLRRRIAVGGSDEVARMASSFNAMLDRVQSSQAALEASSRAQRQLVADASHELRTPVASLRTNVEVLQLAGDFSDGQRASLLADVVEQTDELTALVGDLIELARGDEPTTDIEDLDLAGIVRDALLRARRHAPATTFVEQLEPWPINGSRERLSRAVNNLLDNAAKFSPPGAKVEVQLRGGDLRVRDHGPGVPPDELPHIFDRFYRARNAASHHGSGLGLAIVKQVADAHGARISARSADDGGLVVHLSFGDGAQHLPPDPGAGRGRPNARSGMT